MHPHYPHPFPTRRSSDLELSTSAYENHQKPGDNARVPVDSTARWVRTAARSSRRNDGYSDRKSTRLNSSHLGISYAVFCLLKKKAVARLGCCVCHETIT